MRFLRLAALLAVTALVGTAHSSADTGGPTGLHAFLLRTDDPATTSFSRTPSFAWNPVPGALHYEFQLSLSTTFRDNSVVYADLNVQYPVEAPGITLPWITGNPHSLYARVRAITANGATPWSANYGFDMVAPAAPTPLPSYPGVLRWTPSEGSAGYEIWFVDIPKMVTVTTNVLDEREFYTFHPTLNWMGTIRWRIRAIRADIVFANNTGTSRYNQIPAVQYGPWSPTYSSTNPAFPTNPQSGTPDNPIGLVGTVSDVFSNGSSGSPAHKLMPAFLWRGNETLNGTPAELFRVYVFSDKQCLNPVFIGSPVGSPSYAPRPYGSLVLPTSPSGIAAARNTYLYDGANGPTNLMSDWTAITPNENQPHVKPQSQVAGTPGDTSTPPAQSGGGDTSSGSAPVQRPAPGTLIWEGDFGAPVDLWDTDWPQSGYYWTVVGVDAESPGALQTAVSDPGVTAGSPTLPVVSGAGFQIGDVLTVGSGPTAENVTVANVGGNSITISGTFKSNHGTGQLVVRSSGALVYKDMELPQDVCASGREMRFGKSSEPALTSAGDPFATGLSSDGRLTSAVNTTKFYGQPLISWTPALGAEAYEVQWSKTKYPFVAQQYPGALFKGMLTATTSAVLPVGPGTWYYRVRGYDYSLPTGVQQMGWSDLQQIVVAPPTFKITQGSGNKFKIVGKGK